MPNPQRSTRAVTWLRRGQSRARRSLARDWRDFPAREMRRRSRGCAPPLGSPAPRLPALRAPACHCPGAFPLRRKCAETTPGYQHLAPAARGVPSISCEAAGGCLPTGRLPPPSMDTPRRFAASLTPEPKDVRKLAAASARTWLDCNRWCKSGCGKPEAMYDGPYRSLS